MSVRTRFAPSPTGSMHIGNLRTALFAWLFAKKEGGQYILRIEDTDVERSTPESIQVILDTMAWLNLNYDEGPYYQTQRFDRYKEVIQQLLDEGKAYRCYCSKERLEKLRQEQMAQKMKPCYDRYCADLKEYRDEPFVIRFRNPRTGAVVFNDIVRGEISIDNNELDDLVIARSDGVPTYNFSVVVDDIDMAITHVIRGSDHINNTPRQINIYKALVKEPPVFAHLPMILDEDGTKLSKRQGAAGVLFYRDEGYLPEALLNYLVRLGWSHGDQEIFSIDEMIRLFDLNELHKSPACINPKKLDWLNQHYMKTLPPFTVAKHLNEQMTRLGIDLTHGPDLSQVITAQAERCKTLKEMAERSRYFYEEFDHYDEEAVKKHIKPGSKDILKAILEKLKTVEHWKADKLHQIIINYAETNEIGMGKIGMPLRVAITGGSMSPSVDVTLELIGKNRVISRLEKAIDIF